MMTCGERETDVRYSRPFGAHAREGPCATAIPQGSRFCRLRIVLAAPQRSIRCPCEDTRPGRLKAWHTRAADRHGCSTSSMFSGPGADDKRDDHAANKRSGDTDANDPAEGGGLGKKRHRNLR